MTLHAGQELILLFSWTEIRRAAYYIECKLEMRRKQSQRIRLGC